MGIRVVKTAIAALLAIYTAYWIGLDQPLSAGLLAILGVETTRMKGLRSVAARFLASMLGLVFASAVFCAFGFEIWVLSLYILLTFPVLARLQLKDGIVTSSVIVFHLFGSGVITGELILNETLLLLTGLGWATLVNFIYMPREDRKLEQLRQETELWFAAIFHELAETLRDPSHIWSGEQLLAIERAIKEGTRYAGMSRENRMWRHQAYWDTYFAMRGLQFELVQRMTEMIAFIYEKLPQGETVAELFEHLSEDIKSDVYTGNGERRLQEAERQFRAMALPETREEFEVRAALLQLCRELERYLMLAKKWKKKKLPNGDEIK